MTSHRRRVFAGLTGLATLFTVVALTGAPAAQARPVPGERTGSPASRPVTVMTRNLYLGADIERPINAALAAQAGGGTPQDVLVALANATHVTRAVVDQTDFHVRARLLAAEIKRTAPDLVGMQEVAKWRHGPLELDNAGVPNAKRVDHDFLRILLRKLAARHAHYVPVAIGRRADVEAPSFTGSPFAGTMAGHPRDIRLTMRDVVLKRVGSGLRVTGSGDHVYSHNLEIPLLGMTERFNRGYQWVDVRRGATQFRFINTHLESFSSDLAFAQAAELLAGAPRAGAANVFVCDCNSDPLNHTVKTGIGDTKPHSAAYDLITGPGGFTDEWLQWAPAEQGWTSGLSETVDDPTPAGFDHRIDMVFGRSTTGGPLQVVHGQVTGTKVSDRDRRTGLWPSDHGGVVLRLRGF